MEDREASISEKQEYVIHCIRRKCKEQEQMQDTGLTQSEMEGNSYMIISTSAMIKAARWPAEKCKVTVVGESSCQERENK